MRAVVDREIIARVRVENEDGALSSADSTPTIAVVDGAGAAVTGLSSVTEDGVGSGVYKVTIPAQTKLDILEATWTIVEGGLTRKVREEIKVVSARFVDLWRLKENTELGALSGSNLRRVADAVEDWFTSALGFPPTLEGARLAFRSPGGPRLLLSGIYYPDEVYEASQGSTALTAAELAKLKLRTGYIEWSDSTSWKTDEITMWLTHGLGEPPEDLRRTAVTLAVYASRRPDEKTPERATRISTENTDIVLSLPAPDRPTGLPDVDTAIVRYRVELPL